MKRIFCLLLTFSLCFAILGCSKDKEKDEEKVYYTVTFNSQGGSDVPTQQVLSNNPITRPTSPTREGYFFSGWHKDSMSTGNDWNFASERVTANITLYAGWTIDTNENPTSSLTYKLENGTYTVTGVGDETIVIIPSQYNNIPVTKIQGDYGNGAFARKDIIKVTIPDSIIEIGQNSFNNCQVLTSVNISTTSQLTTIGNNAFSGNSSLKELYLPSGLTNLGDSVFNNCGAIEQFIVADENVFYYSENGHLINKVTNQLIRGANNSIIPSGVTSIAQAAFRKSTITSLTIPATVKEIANYIIQDSAITKIVYDSTEEDWNRITKSQLWNLGKTTIEIAYSTNDNDELKILIVYFSATNNTEAVALALKELTGGDLYEIIPQIPYTSSDLDYQNRNSRTSLESNDPTARPAIVDNDIANFAEYDVVYIGYPIWWGSLPKIMYTFFDKYNFTGKIIMPFCTSGGSGIASSVSLIRSFEPNAIVKDGLRVTNNTQLNAWLYKE